MNYRNYKKLDRLLDKALAIKGVNVRVVYDDGSESVTNLLNCIVNPENINEIILLSELPRGYQKAYEACVGLIGALHDVGREQ